jgi:hypothetical protein
VGQLIEQIEVEGRPATVSYLTDDFRPADKGQETLVKVVFLDDEGGILFGVPVRKDKETDNE